MSRVPTRSTRFGYWADHLPPGALFDPATHILSWTPAFGDAGTYNNVTLFVSDGIHTLSQSFTLLIAIILLRPARF